MVRLKLMKCSNEHFYRVRENLEPLETEYEVYIKSVGLNKLSVNSVVEFGSDRRIFYKEIPFNTEPYIGVRFTQHYIQGTKDMYVLKYTNIAKIELDRNPTCIDNISKLHKGEFNLMCSEDIKKSLASIEAISHNLDVLTFLKVFKDTWGIEVFDCLLSSTVCNFEKQREYLLLDFLETFTYIRR